MITGENNKALTKKITGMMFITLTIFLGCILIISGVLLVFSSGKQKPFIDEVGNPLARSLSEKVFVNIGGVKQGMFEEPEKMQQILLEDILVDTNTLTD